MPSVIHRGWTPIDEDAFPDTETPRGAAVSARASALMNEWSQINHDEEQEGFRRQAAYEGDGYEEDYDPRHCECEEGADTDPDELCVHDRKALEFVEQAEAVAAEGKRLRKDLIEAELASLGARPMRAYEHWNEDEAYMAWAERDRDY